MRQFEVAPWLLGPAVRLGLRWLGAWPAPIDPAGIAVPTVIVHGVQDVVCPIEGVRAFAAGVRGGRLVELAGAGHDEPERTDPEGVRAAIVDLVARVTSAA
jgi:pimeloyl-ACP methyl ester carboxylesterase